MLSVSDPSTLMSLCDPSALGVGGAPSLPVLLTTASAGAMLLRQQCPGGELVLANAAHWCWQQLTCQFNKTRTWGEDGEVQGCLEELAGDADTEFQECLEELGPDTEFQECLEELVAPDTELLQEGVEELAPDTELLQEGSFGASLRGLPDPLASLCPYLLCLPGAEGKAGHGHGGVRRRRRTPTQEERLQQEVKELEAAPSSISRTWKLRDARSRLVAHQEARQAKLRVYREARQAKLREAKDFLVFRILPALAIVGATACCCSTDREQQRFRRARHRYYETICDSADPHRGSRLETPSTHLTRRGLELRVIGDRPASEVWRLTLEAWREGRGDLLLTNVSTHKQLRLDSYVEGSFRFLRRRRNAWELAEDINALLSNGFRVSPRAVQHALQVLVSGGGDRPADITSWKIRPRDMIKCVGPDHGRGCAQNCPGSLTHLQCWKGRMGEFFCGKCGINIRPKEMTYRCKTCDCDVCEKCVEQALQSVSGVPLDQRALADLVVRH